VAGASITIELDDREVRQALDRLVRAGADLGRPLHDIGEHLLRSHEERWRRQEGPDGTPWAPLSPRYARRKAKKRPRAGILTFDEHLRRLHYNVSDATLELGTNLVYGATHQFGAPERGIPARPFLGLADDDEAAILEIIRRHLEEAVGGR